MLKFGLIGSDIARSQSPWLFARAYPGLSYELLEGTEFKPLWRRFLEDFDGVNVTAPFKEDAFAQVAALCADGRGVLSGPALRTGAVNIAAKTSEGLIHGDNSDFAAVILTICETCFPGITKEFHDTFGKDFVKKIHQFFKARAAEAVFKRKPKALVAGCGGAGRAAAVAAAELGCSVAIANRTMERAASFVLDLPKEYDMAVCPTSLLKPAVKDADIIIYAASGALAELSSLEKEDFSGRVKIILEASYAKPSFSGDLLGKALEAGATYIPGEEWLRAQALAGFPVLTGREPETSHLIP